MLGSPLLLDPIYLERPMNNPDPSTAYGLLAMLCLGAVVWAYHVFTRDWNENKDRIRRESHTISNHRRFAMEYHRRAIASHVAGVKRVNSHYAPDGQIPVCGIPRHRREKRALFVPLVRYVTCDACHDYLQLMALRHYQEKKSV